MRTMTETERDALNTHQQVLAVLPFYATGALADNERESVAQHVRQCITCRRELANEQRTHDAFQTLNLEVAKTDMALQTLWARIDLPASSPLPNLSPRRVTWSRRRLPLAAVAAVILSVLVLTLQRAQFPANATVPAVYRTLAVNESASYQLVGEARVAFRADVSRTRAQLTLAMYGFDLLDGPDALGVYSVQRRAGSPAPLEGALAELDRHETVMMARAVSNDEAQP